MRGDAVVAPHPGGSTRAALFDVDGLLADTEPLWQDAELEVFSELGVPLTRDDCRSTMGLRIDEVVDHWAERRPWHGVPRSEVVGRVLDRVCALVGDREVALPGVHHAVDLAHELGLAVGVASSSPERVIRAVLAAVGLEGRFAVVASAEHERWGKPHPAVFLAAADALRVEPTACVVLEDSPNGVIAAKAARMRCIAVPDPSVAADPRMAVADVVLTSLEHLDGAALLGYRPPAPGGSTT